jgi:phage tail sheath gpL-like
MPRVEALGVLAKHHEVAVARASALQRHQPVGEAQHRADVGVQVEAEAHAEQDVVRVAVVGHAAVPHGAQQHGVELALQAAAHVVGERDSVAQEALGAQVERLAREVTCADLAEGRDHLGAHGHHLGAHAVTADERDVAGAHQSS